MAAPVEAAVAVRAPVVGVHPVRVAGASLPAVARRVPAAVPVAAAVEDSPAVVVPVAVGVEVSPVVVVPAAVPAAVSPVAAALARSSGRGARRSAVAAKN